MQLNFHISYIKAKGSHNFKAIYLRLCLTFGVNEFVVYEFYGNKYLIDIEKERTI